MFSPSNKFSKPKLKANLAVGTFKPIHSISAYAKVFETQWVWLKAGQNIKMTVRSFPGKVWNGTVKHVEDLAQSSTTAVKLTADFQANESTQLRLGMQTEMNVIAELKESVLLVPFSSVIQTEFKSIIIIAKPEGHFQPIDVEVGLDDGKNIEILSGLKEGMKVVVSGQFLIDSESQISSEISRLTSSEGQN